MPAGGLARLPRITATAGQLGQQPRGFHFIISVVPDTVRCLFQRRIHPGRSHLKP